MKKQRSLDSREQNRYKRLRRDQRRAKGEIHRIHLRARLDELHQALEVPLPADWAILYPELAEVLGQSEWGMEWAVFEAAAPWFCRLSRQRGHHFSRKKEREDSRFWFELIILTSVLNRWARMALAS